MQKSGDCIKNLALYAHDAQGNSRDFVFMNIGFDALKEGEKGGVEYTQITEFFSGVKFCKEGCKITLRSCSLGKSLNLKSNLENRTGCTVELYAGLVDIFGNEVDPLKAVQKNEK